MRKPTILLAGIVLLVSLSCQLLSPQTPREPTAAPAVAMPTPEPAQPEPTQAPTATLPPAAAAPTETAASAAEPNTLILLENVSLMFWNAKVSYNPAVWEPGPQGNPAALAHRQLYTCKLYEQGPTEPPEAKRKMTLGQVTYMVAEMEWQGNPAHWYMAVNGPQGPFADGVPTLVITSSPDQFEQCRSSAEEVLVTLR